MHAASNQLSIWSMHGLYNQFMLESPLVGKFIEFLWYIVVYAWPVQWKPGPVFGSWCIHGDLPVSLVALMLGSAGDICMQSSHHLYSDVLLHSRSIYRPLGVDCNGLGSHYWWSCSAVDTLYLLVASSHKLCDRMLSCWSLWRALTSVIEGSGWCWWSYSAWVSVHWGSATWLCDNTSGAVLLFPSIHWSLKLNAIKRDLSLWSLGFSTSSSCRLLRIGIKGLWSVRAKCWRPGKNSLHLLIAYVAASSSSSIVA